MNITTKDLHLALLALDSYNRGPDAKLRHEQDQIGSATYKSQAEPNEVSFYAAAYELNGQKVISYRGTDDYGADPFSGWGVSGFDAHAEQGILAAKFFREVTNTETGDPARGEAILTGHSLGGG